MSLVTVISEILRFIKNKLVLIGIGSLIIAALVVGGRYVLNQRIQQAQMAGDEEISSEVMEASYNHLETVYSNEPAEFTFVAVSELDSQLLENSFIIDEYLTTPAVIDHLREETGIDIQPTIEAEKNLGYEKSKDFRGAVAAVRNTSTGEITLRVLAGQNDEENLQLAKAYWNILSDSEVPFLKDYQLSLLSEIGLGETIHEDFLSMVPNENTLSSIQLNDNWTNYIVFGILGFILGIIIMSALLFVIHLFSKRITYAFDYSWGFEDYQQIIPSNSKDLVKVRQFIDFPMVHQRIILNEFTDEPLADINVNAQQLSATMPSPDEIVLIVEAGKTTKKWFNQQYELAKLYQTPVKIIHLI